MTDAPACASASASSNPSPPVPVTIAVRPCCGGMSFAVHLFMAVPFKNCMGVILFCTRCNENFGESMRVGTEAPKESGVREQKRRETLRRITDVGICLFIEKGIDGTTIDEIAEAAGSRDARSSTILDRRTIFCFRSKRDERDDRWRNPDGTLESSPYDAVRLALLKITGSIPSEDMFALDRMMRGSASVQARKQASYALHEATLFSALQQRWPEPDREPRLRLVAMVAVSALRLASEIFNQEGGKRPFPSILDGAFEGLQAELIRNHQ